MQWVIEPVQLSKFVIFVSLCGRPNEPLVRPYLTLMYPQSLKALNTKMLLLSFLLYTNVFELSRSVSFQNGYENIDYIFLFIWFVQ